LDVTDPDRVGKTFKKKLRRQEQSYMVLVDNAGVGEIVLLPTWSDEDLFNIFNYT